MKYEESTVTKLFITDVPKLDPVTVYLENYELGRGKITIEVFGDSWSSSWGAMGDRTIESFVLSCDNHYLSKNLATLSELSEDDYSGFVKNCKENIIQGRRAFNGYDKKQARELWQKLDEVVEDKGWFEDSYNRDLLHEVGGDEWWHLIPSKDSDLFNYLCRILDAIKECLKQRMAAQPQKTPEKA